MTDQLKTVCTVLGLILAVYGLGLLSLEHYSVTTAIYPLYLSISNTVLCLYLLWRRVERRKGAPR